MAEPKAGAPASHHRMTDQEVEELAAILVQEHGHAALNVAENRRSLHAQGSDSFELRTRIASAAAGPLGADGRTPAGAAHHPPGTHPERSEPRDGVFLPRP